MRGLQLGRACFTYAHHAKQSSPLPAHLAAYLRQKPPGTSNLDSSALAKPSEENAAVGNSAPQTSESGGWRFIQPSLLAKLLFHMLQATKRNKTEVIHMQLQWVKYPIFTVA